MSVKSTNLPDEYDNIDDFAALTQEDWDSLDAQLLPSVPQGQPKIDVELDFGETVEPSSSRLGLPIRSKNGAILEADSPLEQFQRTRNLSVTDLVAPAW